MIQSLLRFYTNSGITLRRIPKIHWLSFTYELRPETVHEDEALTIRLATDSDIDYLRNHANADDFIIRSTLKFWDTYGFRSLYLGFFDGETTPTIFQYALDAASNPLYQAMEYGGMYETHGTDSAQVENIYLFRRKRHKRAALRFEHHLFFHLHALGIRRVRTHIQTSNKAALLWARTVGFVPDKWITLILFELPLLRRLPKRFVHTPIREKDYRTFPLNIFQAKK